MTTATKQIDPAALATLTTGTVLVSFSAAHEAAEWVMGHPVWTRQFPALAPQMRAAILEQFPEMPTKTGDSWEACRDAVRARYGSTVEVKQGTNAPVSPLEHIPERFVQSHKS